ncbi:hypothetical protein KY290_024361 [Solanum tuberosum]|uniref:CCHC-type domain-containing protein n=1 Tax=Solanum tuberosum TaxID=4113 RepID=A0ABQ7UQL8_SOLTU|nr:hypothetical protein KY290_024361 [Solanum tuberosum]
MDVKIAAIEKNNTWELTNLPKSQRSIGVRLIYKTKLNESGEVDKYKACLVVKGNKQEYGVDYKEPFARRVARAALRAWYSRIDAYFNLWDVIDGSNTSPPADRPENSSAYKKWKQINVKELLAKQLTSVFIKYGEGDALVVEKRNFKGKSRDMSHSRSSGASSSLRKKEKSSNYSGKKPLRCYCCGEVGHIKRYCRAKESNMDQKVAEEEEEWGKCLVAETRAIDDVPTGDMVAAIEEIREENLEHAISETICASGDLYKESIERDVLKVKVYDQSSVISRSINDSEQILKAYGESRDQIEEEADIEVFETNNMIFESSEDAKKSIEELI